MNTEKLECVISDYILGIRIEEMAEKYGFEEQAMKNFCHGLFLIGIITEKQRAERRKKLIKEKYRKRNADRNEKIRKRYEEDGESVKTIAEEFSMTESGIRSVIYKNELAKKKTPYPQNLVQAILQNQELENTEYYWGIIEPIINKLKEREQFVIKEKYQNNKTYAQIGESFGVSRQRAQDMCAYSFRKIRSQYYNESETV